MSIWEDLFGLDDERRKRALPGVIPLNPDAEMPEVLLRRPLPALGMPDGAMAAPESLSPVPLPPPPTHSQRLEAERQSAERSTPGRGKSILLGLAQGALQGLATGGGLSAALGGAAAGGLVGGVSPRTLQMQRFNQYIKPQLLEQFRMEDLDAALARQQQQDLMEGRLGQARLADLQAGTELKRSEAEKNRFPRPERGQPLMETAGGIFDPNLRQYIPGTAPPERQPNPHYEWTDKGLVDVSKLSPEERRKLRPFQRPTSSRAPKQARKSVGITDVMEWAGQQNPPLSKSQAIAKWENDGFKVTR